METEKDVKNIYYKVPKQRDLISRITLEILAVGGISIFLLARYVWDKSKLPYDRGFYCNDGNLKHPYLKETISEKKTAKCDGGQTITLAVLCPQADTNRQ